MVLDEKNNRKIRGSIWNMKRIKEYLEKAVRCFVCDIGRIQRLGFSDDFKNFKF